MSGSRRNGLYLCQLFNLPSYGVCAEQVFKRPNNRQIGNRLKDTIDLLPSEQGDLDVLAGDNDPANAIGVNLRVIPKIYKALVGHIALRVQPQVSKGGTHAILVARYKRHAPSVAQGSAAPSCEYRDSLHCTPLTIPKPATAPPAGSAASVLDRSRSRSSYELDTSQASGMGRSHFTSTTSIPSIQTTATSAATAIAATGINTE